MKKKTIKYESISKRLLKNFLKILIVFFLLLFFFLVLFFSHVLRVEIKDRSAEYTKFVKNLVHDSVLNYNLYEVGKIVNNETGQKNILFIAVFDKDKNLITSNLYYVENRDKLGKSENFNIDETQIKVEKFSIFGGKNNGFVDIFSPILGMNKKKIGFLHIGMVFPGFVKLYRTLPLILAILILLFSIVISYFFHSSLNFFENALDDILSSLDTFLSGDFSSKIKFKTNTRLDLIREKINLLFEKFVNEHETKENLLKNLDSEINKKNVSLMRIKEFYENILDKVGDYVYVLDSSGFVKFANSNFREKLENFGEFQKVPILINLKDRVRTPFNVLKNFLKAYKGENVFFREDVREFDGSIISFDIFMAPIRGIMGEKNVLVVGRESLKDVIKKEEMIDVDTLIEMGKVVYLDFKFIENIFVSGENINEIKESVDSILEKFDSDFVVRCSNRDVIKILDYINRKIDVLKKDVPIEEGLFIDECQLSVEKKFLNEFFSYFRNVYEMFLKKKKVRKVIFSLDQKIIGKRKFVVIRVSYMGIKFNKVITSPYEILSKKLDMTKQDVKFFLSSLPIIIGAYENSGFLRFNKKYSDLTIELFLPVETIKKKNVVKKSVLLIDDEESIVEVVKDYLNEFGYKVLTANCGEDGVQIYKNHLDEIFAVIVDIMMPGMGGKRTYEEIRKLDRNVHIFFASGYSGVDFSEADLKGDKKVSFLNKPFDFDELLKELNLILSS